MSGLAFLIPVALCMGLAGLAAFFWAMRSGQFEDPEGSARRILIDAEAPAADRNERHSHRDTSLKIKPPNPFVGGRQDSDHPK